eukprot:Phypoly_transcript_06441.p1 GENE.Phypoly_transcript_06441~~Phypoly_transcript_06441.p1  ORF type:complete len:552 (+),score=139.77 Phypoly_transcript_06441:122-1777(+)
MEVFERVTSLFPIAKGLVVSPQESAASIQRVAQEFEKVYTSINKFNSSVSEGAEQISVHTISLKKKLQELKKALIQPANVTTDAAAKNAEIVKIQEKVRSLKAQGKNTEEYEKQLAECNEQFKALMSPESSQTQRAAISRNVVGIVDNLGQIVFKTLSDQFVVRDSIKAYLIATISAKKLAVGDKPKVEKKEKETEEKQEKGTLERMATGLLKHSEEKQKEKSEKKEKSTLERTAISLSKHAGVFLELANQLGIEIPKDFQGEVKPTENAKAHDAHTITASLAQIDANVRSMNQVARSTDKIDALVVDDMVKKVEEIVTAMKRIEDVAKVLNKPVQQAVVESQAAIHVAEYESNPTGFKIPPIRSTDEAILKLKALIRVLHDYLVPSLVATPLVYLHDKDWGMKSHSEFRAARRKELNDLSPHVTANMPLDALRECISEFIQTFTQVLHVKIPAMHEVHPDDSTILNRVKWAPERAALRTELEAETKKLADPKSRNSPNAICLVVQNLVRVMMRFLTFKPVGRPHVFKNDAEWALVSESKLRFQLRKELLL